MLIDPRSALNNSEKYKNLDLGYARNLLFRNHHVRYSLSHVLHTLLML